MTATKPVEALGCNGCPATVDRRRFLRHTAAAAAATMLASGFAPASALAASIGEIIPRRLVGSRLAYAVPPLDSVLVDSDNDVIVARWGNRIYAFSTKCPHRGAPLEWRANESRFFCRKHKARFTPDGNHQSGRKTTALDRYPLRMEGTEILVSRDSVLRQDEDPVAWSKAVIRI